MKAGVFLVAAWLVAASARAGDGAPLAPLAHDPFMRPALVEHPPAPAQPESAPPLELRAILAAGSASSVDVGGRIVHVGEEIEGFRLTAVSEDGAVFERGGRSLHVPLPTHAATPAETPALVEEDSDDAN